MTTKGIIATVVIASMIVAQPLMAQFSGSGPSTLAPPLPLPPPVPEVPFDGGMSIVLLASGIGYASKKLKQLKCTPNQDTSFIG
jgi:hypothetical protein